MTNKLRIEFDSLGSKKLIKISFGVRKLKDPLKILKLAVKKYHQN